MIIIIKGADITKVDVVSMLYICINGILVLPIAFTFLTIGPNYITAPEVSLYTEIETILGPVWVYLGGYEAPPKLTLIGGIILLLSLTIHSILSLREIHKEKKIKDEKKYIEVHDNNNNNDDDKL